MTRQRPTSGSSSLDREIACNQQVPDPLAQVPLQLDAVFADGTAGAAGALEVRREMFEEVSVPGQAEHDRHRLAAATGLFDPQLGDGTIRHRGGRLLAAAAAAFRLTAAGTDPSRRGGVDEARTAIGHASSLSG